MSTANIFPIHSDLFPENGFIARAEPVTSSQYWSLGNKKPKITHDGRTLDKSHPEDGCVARTEPVTSPQYTSHCWSFGKPKITFNGRTADENLHALKTMITSGSWSESTVTNYLISVILKEKDVFEGTLTEEWLCKPHLKIGDKNSKITPLDLLDVITDASHEKYQPPTMSSVSSTAVHKSRFASLLYIYRAASARSSAEQNWTAIQKRLQIVLTSSHWGVHKEHFSDLDGFVFESRLTPDYRKIIAAVDMFFNYFPLHNSSNIRFCTIVSRYRGCRALTLLTEISTALGLEPNELVCFALTTRLTKEVWAIARLGQHAEDIKGYFPYQLDLGIVSKSAYSVKANPTLCLWLHTMGTMLNNSSSAKAVKVGYFMEDEATISTAVNVVQWLRDGSGMLPRFPPNATLVDKMEQIFLHYCDNGLNQAQREDARKRFEPHSNLRSNTIGHYLATRNFSSLLYLN